jgi:hypothetical protein
MPSSEEKILNSIEETIESSRVLSYFRDIPLEDSWHSVSKEFRRMATYRIFKEEEISKFNTEIAEIKRDHKSEKEFYDVVGKLKKSVGLFQIGQKHRNELNDQLNPAIISITVITSMIFIYGVSELVSPLGGVFLGALVTILLSWINYSFQYTLKRADYVMILLESIN